MRKAQTILYFLIITFCLQTDALSAPEVWLRQDLQTMGVIRLADIFRYLPGWQQHSTDGFNNSGYALSNPVSPTAEDPALLLNGIPFQLHPFQPVTANLLPITVDMVDTVFVYDEPVWIEGQFFPAGAVNFVTRQEKRKSGFRARDMIGNETGDPGPYAYTEYATPNVDRLGPDYSGGADLHWGSLRVRTNLSWRHHYYTDPELMRQNPRISSKNMRGHWVTPYLQISGKNKWLLQAHYATTGRFLESFGAYQFYVPEAGKHVPGHLTRRQVEAVSPRWQMGRLNFNAGMQFSHHRWEEIQQANPRRAEYGKSTVWINGKMHWRNHRLFFAAESGLDALEENPDGTSSRFRPLRISAALAAPTTGSGWHYRLHTQWHILQDEVAPQINLSFGRELSARQRVTASALYFVRSPLQNQLLKEKRAFFAPIAQGGADNADIPPSKSLRLSLNYRWHRSTRTTLFITTGWLKNNSWYAEEFGTNRFSGQMVFANIAIRHQLFPNLRYQIQFSGRLPAGSDESYRQLVKSHPRFQADGQFFYQMSPSFSIFLFSRYISASELPAFRDGRVSDKWLWDCTLHKSLWKKRAYFQVVFRNLFDDEERNHPQGARMNFRWFVQFGLNINTG